MNLQSENINELIGALAKAQGKIITAKKDKKNPFFKSSYADLSSIWDACRAVLSENGLAVVQTVQSIENKMELVTILAHASGQWIRSQMPVVLAKSDPQSIGSALTYYRRYALAAIVGVAAADEDDDGNTASERKVEEKLITYSQAKELKEMLEACSPTYKDKIWKSLRSMGISALENLPMAQYDRLKSSMINSKNVSSSEPIIDYTKASAA